MRIIRIEGLQIFVAGVEISLDFGQKAQMTAEILRKGQSEKVSKWLKVILRVEEKMAVFTAFL